MTTLVAGASGATGRLLVRQLLNRGQNVKAVIRPESKIPADWEHDGRVNIIRTSILDMHQPELADHLKDCTAVASCLGHNITIKGILGKPRLLVTDSVKKICNALLSGGDNHSIRFVLMNTTGVSNKADEKRAFFDKIIMSLISMLLPPQADNESAAEYLSSVIGLHNRRIEWVAVRPDSLVNHDFVTDYDTYPSPVRSPLFNPGKTSRINVGDFMAELITNDELWSKWRGGMPVIYNRNDEA